MRIFLCAIVITLLTLSSCTTQSYLTQSNQSTTDKAEFILTQAALAKPNICIDQIHEELYDNHANENKSDKKSKFLTNLNRTVNNIIAKAHTYLGTPYRYGGTTRRGIDCSSFMQHIYEVEGIQLPRVSSHQAKIGIPISKSDLQKGDLVFFSTTSKYRVTHVGMVVDVEEDDITFIHAASSKGVSTASLNNPYWKKRYRSARRPNKLSPPFERRYANLHNDSVRTLASLRN